MSSSPAPCRILVVDDDSNARVLQAAIIASAGHQVAEASSAEEALEMLESGSYDLLVSDVMMLRMDGIELARKVRRDGRFSDMPIILVTALEDRETRIRCLEVADAAMVKPMDREELRVQIGSLLRGRIRILSLRQKAE
jgi:putative two-component system response regulator